MPRITREEAKRLEQAKIASRQPGRNSPPHKNGAAVPAVILRNAASYDMKPIDWLWRGWLARGKLHLLAGVPGTGKTTLGLNIAAILSTGGLWPDPERTRQGDDERAPQGDVLIWSGEDDVEDTLLPRLVAAGADLNRIKIISATADENGPRPFDPGHDIKKLGNAIELNPPLAVILDPVSAAIIGDSHKSTEVRHDLQPLVDLAARFHFAAIGIHHFAKGTQGREPLERLLGAGAFGALPRVVLVATSAAKSGEPSRLVRAKSNIGPHGGGFEYHPTQRFLDIQGDQRVEAQFIDWGGYVEGSPRDLLAIEQIDVHESQRDKAEEFLRQFLAGGTPHPVKIIEEAAKAHGHAMATVQRAKTKLGVKAIKVALQGGWAWVLEQPKSPIDTEGDQLL